jgi:hypothetical protein
VSEKQHQEATKRKAEPEAEAPDADPAPAPEKPKAGPNVMGGLAMIAVGVIFLLLNMGIVDPGDNWWAYFILFGTVGAWAAAWRAFRAAGNRLDGQARSAFIGGFYPLTVALIFLFNLDWGRVWPVFILLTGVLVLFGGSGRKRD